MQNLIALNVQDLAEMVAKARTVAANTNLAAGVFRSLVQQFGSQPDQIPAVILPTYFTAKDQFDEWYQKNTNARLEALTAIGQLEAMASAADTGVRLSTLSHLHKAPYLRQIVEATEYKHDLFSDVSKAERAALYVEYYEKGVVQGYVSDEPAYEPEDDYGMA